MQITYHLKTVTVAGLMLSLIFLIGCNSGQGFNLTNNVANSPDTDIAPLPVEVKKPDPVVKSPVLPAADSQSSSQVLEPGEVSATAPSSPSAKASDQSATAHSQPISQKDTKTRSGDLSDQGLITPTVYYTPVVEETGKTCSSEDRVGLHDKMGEILILVCPKTASLCDEQGTCFIQNKGKIRKFNVVSKVHGQDHYEELNDSDCMYGLGVEDICLDPFYSIAADLRYYKTGDVVFLPAVKGIQLPDGTQHSGYFIVRDDGRGIVGHGRFDFFSGFLSWTNPKNPFVQKIKLADPNTHVEFFMVTGQKAIDARKARNFPSK